jgi:hypothetical protein
MRSSRPALSILAVLALGGCAVPTDPVPAPSPSTAPETTLERVADPDYDSFRYSGEDPDGDLQGFEYQLVEVDDVYVDTEGASGSVVAGVDPLDPDGWSPVLPSGAARFQLGARAYRFRVRAVDGQGNRDATPEEILWRRESDRPSVSLKSGCGALYPDPAPVTLAITATDLRYDQTPSPASDLLYSWELIPDLYPWPASGCPEFPVTSNGWIPFPADGGNPQIRIDELGSATIVPAGNGHVAACQWRFHVVVQDPEGNTGSHQCTVVILQ